VNDVLEQCKSVFVTHLRQAVMTETCHDCEILLGLSDPEDGDSRLLRNISNYLPVLTALQPFKHIDIVATGVNRPYSVLSVTLNRTLV
jgi:hypothetical protein